MTDEKIVNKWRQAVRMHSKPNQLAKLIALQMADELEKDGVTEADIDRLFPERKALTAAPASAAHSNKFRSSLENVAESLSSRPRELRGPFDSGATAALAGAAEPIAWHFEWKPSTNSNPWQADVSLKDPRINPVRDIRNVRPLYAGAACDADGECGQ